MLVVQQLEAFPKDAQPFTDNEEVEQVVTERRLLINDSMCTLCPPVPATMQLPHVFVHEYAGMERLQRGQQEWQMYQIVRSFVKENQTELTEDTAEYFSALPGKQSVVKYARSLSKNFKLPDVVQVYLLSHACNMHTHVHFANCVWSTVDEAMSFYVALDLAVVGEKFVPLHSADQEILECVVGQIRILQDPDVMYVSSEGSDGEPSDVEVAVALEAMDTAEWENFWSKGESEGGTAVTCPCFVQVECMVHAACRQLSTTPKVKLEHLSRSATRPSVLFKGAKKNEI